MKKLIAIVLSVAMLVSCIPMTVFAQPAEEEEKGFVPDERIEMINKMIIELVTSEEFQENFKKADAFITKYVELIEKYQQYANDFVFDEELRKQYLDDLDEIIDNINEFIIRIAETEEAQAILAKLKDIKENLIQLRNNIVELVKNVDANVQAAIQEIAVRLKEQYQAVKDYFDYLEGLVSDELQEIIDALRVAAYNVKEYTESELWQIIGRIRELEALIYNEFYQKIGEISDDIVALIERAEGLAKAVVDKVVTQINGALDVLEKAIEDPEEFTKEQLVKLVRSLRMLQQFVVFKIAEASERVQALIKQIDEKIENVVIPALQNMIEDLKAKAGQVINYTEEQIKALINDLVEKAEMLQDIIACEIAWEHEQIRKLVDEAKYWLEEVAAPALQKMIEDLQTMAQNVKDWTEQEIMELIEKAELLQRFIACKIAKECERLQALIAEAKEWLEEVAAPALQDLIEDLKEKAQAIKDFTEKEIEELLMKAEQLKMFIACTIFHEIEDLKEMIIIAENWAKKAVTKAMDQIIDTTKAIIKKAAQIVKADVIKYFQMLREFKEIVKKYIDIIKEFDPREEIKELIEKAEELFEQSIEWMREKAIELTTELIDDLESGKFDWLLKPLGITGEELVDLLIDATAYAFGVMNGEGYLDLQDELAAALAQLNAALALLDEAEAELDPTNPDGKVYALVQEISNLTSQLQQISTENAQLKNQVEELIKKDDAESEIIKKFINGYNVTKKKPTLKKVKAIKGRKVRVTFKSLSKVDATQYRFNYKTGKKKAKNKKWNKKTSGSKTLNYTLKKLKKGKTYKIKVRGAYSFKYEGKTYTFLSKWSKTKKVKVK